jgi:hypothetical protein
LFVNGECPVKKFTLMFKYSTLNCIKSIYSLENFYFLKKFSLSKMKYGDSSLIYSVTHFIKRVSDTRFSTSGFFHKSVSPGPLSILLGSFRLFSKIRGDFRD